MLNNAPIRIFVDYPDECFRHDIGDDIKFAYSAATIYTLNGLHTLLAFPPLSTWFYNQMVDELYGLVELYVTTKFEDLFELGDIVTFTVSDIYDNMLEDSMLCSILRRNEQLKDKLILDMIRYTYSLICTLLSRADVQHHINDDTIVHVIDEQSHLIIVLSS